MQFATILKILYLILMVVYGFYQMILSIITMVKFGSLAENYNYLVANFESEPIYNISVKAQCDDSEEFLFGYRWPGTYYGCKCQSGNTFGQTCTSNQTEDGCKSVQEYPQQNMNFWDNGLGQPVNLCAKRLKDYSLFKKSQKDAHIKCQSNEIQCGGAQPENKFCAPSNLGCPITFWMISSSNPNPVVYDESMTISNALKLFYTRQGNALPVSELRLTQGENVCMDNKNDNIAKGASNYPFLRRNKTTCYNGYDKRFLRFSEIGELLYFQLNQIYDQKIPHLPGYSLENQFKYGAYFRNYLPWKIEHRDKIKELVDYKNAIGDMKSFQIVILVVNIFACIAISIILQISEVYNMMGKDVPCIDGEGETEKKRIEMYKRIFKYVFKIIQTPFFILGYVISSKVKNYFEDLAQNKVSDDNANSVIEDISQFVKNDVYQSNLNMLIFLIIMVVIDLIFEIKQYFARKHQQQQDTQVQPVQNNQENQDKPNEMPKQEVKDLNENQAQTQLTNQDLTTKQQEQPVIVNNQQQLQSGPPQYQPQQFQYQPEQPLYQPQQPQYQPQQPQYQPQYQQYQPQQQQYPPGYQQMPTNVQMPVAYGQPIIYQQPPAYGQQPIYGQPQFQQDNQQGYQQIPQQGQGYNQMQSGQFLIDPNNPNNNPYGQN